MHTHACTRTSTQSSVAGAPRGPASLCHPCSAHQWSVPSAPAGERLVGRVHLPAGTGAADGEQQLLRHGECPGGPGPAGPGLPAAPAACSPRPNAASQLCVWPEPPRRNRDGRDGSRARALPCCHPWASGCVCRSGPRARVPARPPRFVTRWPGARLPSSLPKAPGDRVPCVISRSRGGFFFSETLWAWEGTCRLL